MKRIMHRLTLGKIAAVDRPCQEGAIAVITKRAAEDIDDSAYEQICKRTFTAEQRRQADESGAAMPGGRYPIENKSDLENAIRAVGRGKGSHAAIRAHIVRRAKALGASNLIPDTWHDGGKIKKALADAFEKAGLQLAAPDGDEGAEDFDALLAEQCLTQQFWDAYYKATSALQASLVTIMGDDTVADKGPLITQTLQQFADYIEGILPTPVGKSLAAGIAAIAGGAGTTDKGDAMSEAMKKALGLQATATEAEVNKALTDLVAKAAEHDKALKRADAIAKMSDKHRDFMNHAKAKLPEGGKDRFVEMSDSQRDEHIEKNAIEVDDVEKMVKSGEAFRAINGQIITKRDAGNMFGFLKSQDDEIRKNKEEIANAAEREAVATFEKRATDLGFAKEFGATLRKAYAGDAASQTAVEKEIAALRKQVETGKLFGEMGKSSAQTGTAYAELVAKAEELRKGNPKLTDAQAFAKVYEDRGNAEIVKRYKAEQRTAA